MSKKTTERNWGNEKKSDFEMTRKIKITKKRETEKNQYEEDKLNH